jgi:Mrp family chromosome partitioning ATPase/uncharacterized protein involved in exopolysaccharide biosynthesis
MSEPDQSNGSISLAHQRHAWRIGFLTRYYGCRRQLVRRWWLLLGALVLGLGIQAMVWRFQQPLFISAGRMIVNLKLSIPEGSLYTEELNNFLGTQAALMQSAAVIRHAQERVGERRPTTDPQPVTLKALIQPKTTIFVLQGTGPNATYTREFVQACMEQYINLKKEMREQTSDTTLAGLTEEVARLETDLRKSDQALVGFQSSNSVILLQEQGNSAGNFLAGLTQRLAALKSEYSLLEALSLNQILERQERLEANSSILSTESAVPAAWESAALTDSDYVRARQQVLVLKAQQQDLGQYLRPKHPKMAELGEEIARRERLLAIFREETAAQLESRKAWLKVQMQNLEGEVREWDARALEISRKNAEFQRLKAKSQRTQALYDRLLATMQTLDLNKQISPESVSIMEPASTAVPDRPGLGQKLGVGAAAGLVAGVLLMILLDRLDDRIGSLFEVQELFDEEVIGQIPRERSALRKGQPGLLAPQDERYAFVEAYRNLRSSLLYMGQPEQRPQTLLVTSSVPNDGKSLTAANLAITLASTGAKVLLVDADLRKGSLHHRFGLATGMPGLSEALGQDSSPSPNRDAVPDLVNSIAQNGFIPSPEFAPKTIPPALPQWAGFVQSTKVANLFLLPRGDTTHRSSELFLGLSTVRFLDDAARLYEFVILDTAPVMAADDVTSLAPQVDGVLFVVRAEHTSARVARAALDLLYLRQVRVLGLVFNAVPPASADYYYYYQYKDYHQSYPTA